MSAKLSIMFSLASHFRDTNCTSRWMLRLWSCPAVTKENALRTPRDFWSRIIPRSLSCCPWWYSRNSIGIACRSKKLMSENSSLAKTSCCWICLNEMIQVSATARGVSESLPTVSNSSVSRLTRSWSLLSRRWRYSPTDIVFSSINVAAWASVSGRCSSRLASANNSSEATSCSLRLARRSPVASSSFIALISIGGFPLASFRPACLFRVVTIIEPWEHSGIYHPSPSGLFGSRNEEKKSCVSSALLITITHCPRSLLPSHPFTSGRTSTMGSS